MAIAEGLLIAVFAAILGGLLPAGVFAEISTPTVQSPREQLRSPIPPGVRPKPARPGITLESGSR